MGATAAIILAAGKGTRMKSDLVKVMHSLGGCPMIEYPVAAAREAGASRIVIVAGHQSEKVREYFSGGDEIDFALQEQQLGTGHAVACARPSLEGFSGRVLILCGDVPLLKADTLKEMMDCHKENGAVLTVLTSRPDNPFGYGRVVKGVGGTVLRIVEEKDANDTEREIREVNSGIYCVESGFLFDAIAHLSNDNAQGEYYLTDIVQMAAAAGLSVTSFPVSCAEEVMGVNDRVQLAEAGSIIRKRVNQSLMYAGVTIVDPSVTYIDRGVKIGKDTIVYPNVHIQGVTEIGENCVIEPSSVIRGCRIGDGVTIKAGSVMADAIVHNSVSIGPMAHLRPGTELMNHVKIGNFVEIKKAYVGEDSKASHLTYLGDATIGKGVNIGCGTITCNYDGVKKHRTVIEDNVFVGSDVQLVAPVTIGRNSLIAAGTTVTKDVPSDSLAIARTPQVNKEGWVKEREKGKGK
jgi:bifunctional UDP-N-acetylglucosamine pyrophosphorylase / glucosamine-1-phosphate N-acetyltransferase